MSQLASLLSEINTELGTPITRTMLIAALRDLANVSTSTAMTKVEAEAYSFTNPPEILHTTGYFAHGDFGAAAYQKVDTFTTPLASTLRNSSLTYHVGTFTTADGTKYQMIPRDANVCPNAFGAKSGAGGDFSLDEPNWQAFEDCKYWILGQQDVPSAGTSGFRMTLAQGCYNLAAAHSMEGGLYDIYGGASGGATMIRVPDKTDGIQIQHAWGGGSVSIGHEGGAINTGFPISVGLDVYWVGTTKVYRCRTAGTVSNTAPTGTGTNITVPGGTAHVDYIRELTWSEKRFQAGGGVIADLNIWGRWNRNVLTAADAPFDETFSVTEEGAYHSGIVMKNRATIQRVWCGSFPGHGIAVVADGDPEVRAGGNVNQWRLDRVSAYWNGHDGIHVGVSDANGGVGIDIDVASNLRWGVADWSFLGNHWLSIQSAFDGRQFVGAVYPGQCVHNGYWWLARVPALGGDPDPNYHNEPGTDPVSWQMMWGDGQAFPGDDTPIWTNTTRFVPNGAYTSNCIDESTLFLGLYIEGGTNPPQFASQTTVFGAIGVGNSGHGEQVYNGTSWSNPLNVSTNFSSADGTDCAFSAAFGPAQYGDFSTRDAVDGTIFNVQGGGNQHSLGVAKRSTTVPPTITGSIADTVCNSAVFTGQIGVGDGTGANAWANVLFVTSTTSGTVSPGQDLTGAGIPAGTKIGQPSWWPNSFLIWCAGGDKIGGGGSYGPAGNLPGITSEAMSGQFTLPVLTVTAAATDVITPGARVTLVSGTPWTGPAVRIARQLDPATLNNTSFTGGVGKYSLSAGGRTVASTSLYVDAHCGFHSDFAMSKFSDNGLHIWGWTGSDSKRKFGRVNPVRETFFARAMILGNNDHGMDNGAIVMHACSGAPDNGGDYRTGEWRFNLRCWAGDYPAYQFVGTDTGLAGTPKWVGVGTVYS